MTPTAETVEALVERLAYGDCYRACIAHILGVPRHMVPNFGEASIGADQGAATNNARQWLSERGLGIFEAWASEHRTFEQVADDFSRQSPGVPVILHGEAALDGAEPNHAVVLLDGAIVYDPSGAGVKGPAIGNGPANWWLEVIAPTAAALSQPNTVSSR